ncbi:TPA: hypothetical protein L6B08_26840 [Pseudomonas aeruginosa]|nr:hypothetical protein [Pseudomonas aeruginosa]
MTDHAELRRLAERAIGFDMKNDWMFKPVISYQAAANPAAVLDLIAEIEHLRKDAARYRWLRERDLETIRQGGVFAGMTPENIVLNQEDLDAAIDAALEGATQ